MVAGTLKERGIEAWQKTREVPTDSSRASQMELNKQLSLIYDLPFGMSWIRRHPFLQRLPFSPTFGMRAMEDDDLLASSGRPAQDSEKIELYSRAEGTFDSSSNL